MNKNKTETFIVSVNDLSQKTYTPKSKPNKK